MYLPNRVAPKGLEVELVERDRQSVDIKYVLTGETLTGDYETDPYPICKWEGLTDVR
ncbi:hypothetical protein [Natronorubrum sp. A-ect3]|uniref:hypothetical protein n=1 Tax=Natronorubrum sp. A-ect3 TaxID=3242698 RepID=UPI00359CCCCC